MWCRAQAGWEGAAPRGMWSVMTIINMMTIHTQTNSRHDKNETITIQHPTHDGRMSSVMVCGGHEQSWEPPGQSSVTKSQETK